MKKSLLALSLLLSISTIFVSCTKKQVEQLTTQTMTASIGTSSFTAKEVNGQSAANVNAGWSGKTEVSITGSDGTRNVTVALMDWNESNPTLDYTFNSPTPTVIGGYNSGSGADDVAVSGTLHLTTSVGGVYIEGTFDFMTQSGVHVSSGHFYVKIK